MINGAKAQADAHTDGRERLVKMILGRLSRGCYEKAPTSKPGISAGRPTNNGGNDGELHSY